MQTTKLDMKQDMNNGSIRLRRQKNQPILKMTSYNKEGQAIWKRGHLNETDVASRIDGQQHLMAH